MGKHKIEITWEPELLDGGRYIAGISFYGCKIIPTNAPTPGIGKTKDEAIGCFITNAAEYLGLEILDLSGRPSVEDGDWDQATIHKNGKVVYTLNGEIIGDKCLNEHRRFDGFSDL